MGDESEKEFQDYLKQREDNERKNPLKAFIEALNGISTPDTCANPLCPGCMTNRGIGREETIQRVKDVFRTLPQDALVDFVSRLYIGYAGLMQHADPQTHDMLQRVLENEVGQLREKHSVFRAATDGEWFPPGHSGKTN